MKTLTGTCALAGGIFGIFAGAMLLIGIGLIPYWESLSPDQFRLWFSENGFRIGRLMVPLAATSFAVSWLAVWVARKSAIKWFTLISAMALSFIFLEYLFVHKSLNGILLGDQVLSLTQITEYLSQWKTFHWIRIVCGLTGLASTLIGLSKLNGKAGELTHAHA